MVAVCLVQKVAMRTSDIKIESLRESPHRELSASYEPGSQYAFVSYKTWRLMKCHVTGGLVVVASRHEPLVIRFDGLTEADCWRNFFDILSAQVVC